MSDEQWCPCLRWQAEDVNIVPVKRAAQLLVEHINNMISKRRLFVKLCMTVHLVEIILAAKAKSQNGDDVVYYQVTIATQPGDGLFQATFRLHPDCKMVMSPHVSRTSVYGGNPWCLGGNHQYMKRFCTCKEPHRKHARRKVGRKDTRQYSE